MTETKTNVWAKIGAKLLAFVKAIGHFFVDAFQHLPYAFYVQIHPFDGFFRLKADPRHVSVPCSTLLFVLCGLSAVMRNRMLSFMFQNSVEGYWDPFLDFLVTVLPYLLWVISNWCFTSLMDGDGSFRDIYCATGVALIPLTIVNFLQIPLSYMVTLSESTIYDFLGAFALVYTYLMLFAGMMTTHQYSVGKSIITTVLTIVGMAMIVFIVLLMVYLVQQMYGFGDSLYSEIAFRLNE